jgi:hypothetical protein
MPVPGWLSENSLRQYPLMHEPRPVFGTGAPVPTQFIVDFGCEIGDGTEFDPAEHDVYLASVSRAGSTVVIMVRTTAPAMSGDTLVFARSVADAPWTLERSTLTATDAYGSNTFWEGYMVTGPLDTLLAILPDGTTLQGGPGLAFEPSVVRHRAEDRVRSISCANYARITATAPGTKASSPARPVIPHTKGLLGRITFAEGYNCTIRQLAADRTMEVAGEVGYGAGTTCGELKLEPDEEKPDGSVFYSGGPACDEVITAINGLSGRVIKLIGRQGVSVMRDPEDAHAIVIDLNMRDMGSCPPE